MEKVGRRSDRVRGQAKGARVASQDAGHDGGNAEPTSCLRLRELQPETTGSGHASGDLRDLHAKLLRVQGSAIKFDAVLFAPLRGRGAPHGGYQDVCRKCGVSHLPLGDRLAQEV